jgi:hypothetical protein
MLNCSEANYKFLLNGKTAKTIGFGGERGKMNEIYCFTAKKLWNESF